MSKHDDQPFVDVDASTISARLVDAADMAIPPITTFSPISALVHGRIYSFTDTGTIIKAEWDNEPPITAPDTAPVAPAGAAGPPAAPRLG